MEETVSRKALKQESLACFRKSKEVRVAGAKQCRVTEVEDEARKTSALTGKRPGHP